MSKEGNQEERTPRTVADVKEMLSKHSNGEIQRTIQNCITILQNDYVLADAIRLNLLSERIDIVKPVGWPRSGKTLNDTDMKYILLWFAILSTDLPKTSSGCISTTSISASFA